MRDWAGDKGLHGERYIQWRRRIGESEGNNWGWASKASGPQTEARMAEARVERA